MFFIRKGFGDVLRQSIKNVLVMTKGMGIIRSTPFAIPKNIMITSRIYLSAPLKYRHKINPLHRQTPGGIYPIVA